jgi:hypothetical protein
LILCGHNNNNNNNNNNKNNNNHNNHNNNNNTNYIWHSPAYDAQRRRTQTRRISHWSSEN